MRTVGHRKERPISFSASAAALLAGARFNDDLHRLPTGNTSFMPKGVYRFRTHEEANRHQLDCLVAGMAATALERVRGDYSRPAGLLRTTQRARDKDVDDRIILERALQAFREGSGKSGLES